MNDDLIKIRDNRFFSFCNDLFNHFRYLPESLKKKIFKSETVCKIPMKDVLLSHLNGLLQVKNVFKRISELSKSMAKVVITLVASAGYDGSTG